MECYDLKVLSDIHCVVYIDSEFKGVAKRNELTKFPLKKGEYHIKLVSTICEQFFIEEFIFIEYDKIYRANFVQLFESRLDLINDNNIRVLPIENSWRREYTLYNLLVGRRHERVYEIDPWNDGLESIEKLYSFRNGYAYAHPSRKREQYIMDYNEKAVLEGHSGYSCMSEDIVAIKKDGKWGYIHLDTKFCIEPQYDEPSLFKDNIASVAIQKKWGCIDKSGRVVIPIIYDRLIRSEGGYFCVMKDNKWGVIESSGKTIIPIEYDNVFLSRNTSIWIIVKDKKYGAISKSGLQLYQCEYDHLSFCETSRQLVCIKVGKEHFLISNGNKIKLPSNSRTRYYYFLSSQLMVRYEEGDEGWYSEINYVCDLSGKPILRGFDTFDSEQEGYIRVNRGWNWDTVHRGGGQCGYINMKGEEIIPCQFQDAKRFKEGLAAVQIKYKWGFINTNGDIVIPAIYDTVLSFKGGVALVEKGKECFYIDKYGNKL